MEEANSITYASDDFLACKTVKTSVSRSGIQDAFVSSVLANYVKEDVDN
jgi:hypothetical protein